MQTVIHMGGPLDDQYGQIRSRPNHLHLKPEVIMSVFYLVPNGWL